MTRRWPLALLLCPGLAACGGGSGSSSLAPPPVGAPPPPAPTVATRSAFQALTFDQPVAVLQAPGDPSRWYVVEQRGVVQVFDNDPQVLTSSVFIDIRGRVDASAGESGLLGMAFHPDFAVNGGVFLSYTRSGAPLESVIARFLSADGGLTADPASESVVLTVLQDFGNHNGGDLHFGPDGYLYIGFGDGGSAGDPNNRAQDPATLLGKMLRIDVDGAAPYGIPADNPAAGNSRCTQGFGGGPCPEIFASGLRNPWRFSFDRASGELWVGDVGQSSFEEINRLTLGANYGWRIREGADCHNPPSGCTTAGLTDPVHAYGRTAGVSVTGGYVYRGTDIAALAGRYVFGDFGSGRIWALPANPSQGSSAEELLQTVFGISAFGQGADGELLVVDYSNGTLHRLVPGT